MEAAKSQDEKLLVSSCSYNLLVSLKAQGRKDTNGRAKLREPYPRPRSLLRKTKKTMCLILPSQECLDLILAVKAYLTIQVIFIKA